jgi:hypothetical protein
VYRNIRRYVFGRRFLLYSTKIVGSLDSKHFEINYTSSYVFAFIKYCA